MVATPADYAWIRDYRGGFLYQRHCLTLVEGISPAKFLNRISAVPQGLVSGFRALSDQRAEFERQRRDDGPIAYLGAASVTGRGQWTLILEYDGVVGADHTLMGLATVLTQAFSHFSDGKGRRSFCWWEGGDMRAWFTWPSLRPATAPAALLEAIDRVGLTEDPDTRVAEYLALAEELTGVRVTADLLDNAVYTSATVAVPLAEDTTGRNAQNPEPLPRDREIAIRTWAKTRRLKIADNGPIPENIIDLYDSCH